MSRSHIHRRFPLQIAALAVPLGCLIAIGLWGVPSVLSGTTFAALVLLVAGTGTVALLTWHNAQPTGSIGQVIHEVDTGAVRPDAVSGSRP
jgi:hypothetical protein